MSPTSKAVLFGFSFLAASAVLAVVVLFILAFTAGKTIAGGERAAMLAGLVDLTLAVVSIGLFWFLNGSSTLPARIVGTTIFTVLELATLALVFVFTLVLLNR